MDSIDLTVRHSRSLPSIRKSLTVKFSATCNQSELSRLGYEIQKVIRAFTGSKDTLENCKGRNDELFFLSGILPIDDTDLEDEDGINFEYSLITSFEKLESPGKFIEKISERLIGDIPEDIEAKNLTWLAPAFPKVFRAGMEFYSPHFFSSSLGLAPVLREYFEIICSEELVTMNVFSESPGNPELSPLSSPEIWNNICAAFQKSAGILLDDLYKSRLLRT